MILKSLKKCPKGQAGVGAKLRGESGMATGLVMLLTMVLSGLALSIFILTSVHSPRDIRYASLDGALKIVKSNIYAFGQNKAAWAATLAYNKAKSRMACVGAAPGTKCPGATREGVALVLPGGSVYYRHNSLFSDDNSFSDKDGFSIDGRVCDYSQVRANKVAATVGGCLLSVRLEWYPFCAGFACEVGVGKERMMIDLTYETPDQDINGLSTTSSKYYLPLLKNMERSSGPLFIFSKFR